MPGNAVQVSSNGVRVKSGGVVVAGESDPCCCGEHVARYIQAKKVSCELATMDVDLWFVLNDDGTIIVSCDGVDVVKPLPYHFHIGGDNYIVSQNNHISTSHGTLANCAVDGWVDLDCCVYGACVYTYQVTYYRGPKTFSAVALVDINCVAWADMPPGGWHWISGDDATCVFEINVTGFCCGDDVVCNIEENYPIPPDPPVGVSDCPDCTNFYPIYRVTLVGSSPACGSSGATKGDTSPDGSWLVDFHPPVPTVEFPPVGSYTLYDMGDCTIPHVPQPTMSATEVLLGAPPDQIPGMPVNDLKISVRAGTSNAVAFISDHVEPIWTAGTCCRFPKLIHFTDNGTDAESRGWSGGVAMAELINCPGGLV